MFAIALVYALFIIYLCIYLSFIAIMKNTVINSKFHRSTSINSLNICKKKTGNIQHNY